MSFPGWFVVQSGVTSGEPVDGPPADALPPPAAGDSAEAAAEQSCRLTPPRASEWACEGKCPDGGATPSVQLSKLKPNTWTRLRVRAGNGFGWGAWSEPVQYLTDKGGCSLDGSILGADGIEGAYPEVPHKPRAAPAPRA